MGIEQQIKDALQGVVDSHNGNVSKAAEALGVGVQTLWGWMKERRGSKGRSPSEGAPAFLPPFLREHLKSACLSLRVCLKRTCQRGGRPKRLPRQAGRRPRGRQS